MIESMVLNRTKRILMLILVLSKCADSFLSSKTTIHRTQAASSKNDKPAALFYSSNSSNNNHKDDSFSSFEMDVLKQRLMQVRVAVLEEELKKPPNPELSAKEFVREMLVALWDNSNPLPDSGFRALLRSSTPTWRNSLYDSIGVPHNAPEEVVASALGEAISRPHNQFAILVNDKNPEATDENDDDGYPSHSLLHLPTYVIDFPSEVVDYGDGTCWLECRLRGTQKNNRDLYVAMGWELKRREGDGAWLVDQLDWQDFRDEFRPGIGREEWMRICG